MALFVIRQASAEGLSPGGLDQDRLIAVYNEALTFAIPRILDPVPLPRLTLWGLQGLTALDTGLRIAAVDNRLRLFRQNELVLDLPVPPV